MNEFKTYHPAVNFVYFILVTGFSMFLMHPVCLGISLAASFVCSVLFKGKKATGANLLYMLPMMLAMALINAAFNHEGVTILEYLPGGNPLTLESVIYGFAASVMLISVICWFSCYNEVMTSDKFIYLFGKVIPSLSLVLSMALRFVPKFAVQLKIVANAQRCIGRDVSSGTVRERAKHGLAILSIMITWALENAIESADSMKARGYGLPGRTAFSVFTFDRRDRNAFLCICALGIYTLIGILTGKVSYRYFPSVKLSEFSLYALSVFAAYTLLCFVPVIIEIWEVRKWKALKSKI